MSVVWAIHEILDASRKNDNSRGDFIERHWMRMLMLIDHYLSSYSFRIVFDTLCGDEGGCVSLIR